MAWLVERIVLAVVSHGETSLQNQSPTGNWIALAASIASPAGPTPTHLPIEQSWGTTPFMLSDRLAQDPAICGGQPVIKGTRVLVRTVLSYLAHGASVAEILAEFPSLSEDDVRAVVAFAAASAAEDMPAPSPLPAVVKVA